MGVSGAVELDQGTFGVWEGGTVIAVVVLWYKLNFVSSCSA